MWGELEGRIFPAGKSCREVVPRICARVECPWEVALKKAEPSKRPGLKYQWRQLLGAAQTLRTTVHIDMVQHYAQHPFNIQM